MAISNSAFEALRLVIHTCVAPAFSTVLITGFRGSQSFIPYSFLDRRHIQDFTAKAREQVDVLKSMAQTMTDKFSAIADFFSFDKKKYTMEDFFTDVNTFIKQFQVCI